jgi:protein-S-isoprenylcysteine O-methyltransferase Ste14
MWLVSSFTISFDITELTRKVVFLICIVIAVFIAASGIFAFRASKTTVNPRRPDLASDLVVSGIYQYTRNPMYLGLAILLVGWSFYLSNPFSLLCVIGFIAYIGRFQIQPEEKVLTELFGEDFITYQNQVRRWV